jgi:hypothetical protein
MLFVVVLLCLAPGAEARRFTVCAFSFHGPHEIGVFDERLPASDFEFIDLSPHRRPPATAHGDAASWLLQLCRADLRCDMVVYSAEFAGKFFGAYGTALALADMERASCQARCEGLFHTPFEVFLLACNTLATKDQDRRSPADYLEVLLEHGFDQATAERVVETRYGPFGPSFRESLRRVFMGVPRLYGFSSVAPLGEYCAPLLDRYFDAKGDYARWLERAGRSTAPNEELLRVFHDTGLIQTTGLIRAEPAAADRDLVCRVYDESETVGARLRILEGLMDRPDRLAFLPTLQAFIDRHPPEALDADDRRAFDDVRGNEAARAEVLRLVADLGVSTLQLELAHTARHLGWLRADEFRTLAVDAAHALLRRPLTSAVVDIMCEIPRHEPLRDEFDADELPAVLYSNAEGIRLLTCLAPTDPHVSERLLPPLDSADVSTRLWAAYALSERLPLDDPILLRLATYLDDSNADLRERVRWILRTQRPLPDAVRGAVARRDPEVAGMPDAAKPARRWWPW